MTVGRDHAHPVALPLEQRAVQMQTSLVGRNRELRGGDQLRERFHVQRVHRRGFVELREREWFPGMPCTV